LKQVYDSFKEDDIYELLKKENEIIQYIEKQYDKLSTIKNKLCGIYKVYSLLNIESIVLKSKIEHYKVSLTIQEDKEKENPIGKRTIEEAENIVNYFKNKMDMMGEKIKNDTVILNRWDKTAQLYTVLNVYLTYGMIRPSEIIDMKITDTDEGNDKINYINVVSKKIVINNNKNERKGPKVISITDNKINGILLKGLNKYLITNHNNNIYTCSSSFTKMFKNKVDNHNPFNGGHFTIICSSLMMKLLELVKNIIPLQL